MKRNDDNAFASKLIYLRHKAGLNQKKLGELVGVSDRAVSKWECGLSRPSLDACYALSNIFNVRLSDLMGTPNSPKFEEERPPEGMESIKTLFMVGPGPSSSHTIGPKRACEEFKKAFPDCDSVRVVLFGSLAKTGHGHGTDNVIKKAFGEGNVKIELDFLTTDLPHPNTMDMYAVKNGEEIGMWRVTSIGGGKIKINGEGIKNESTTVYRHRTFEEIANFCNEKKIRLSGYVELIEGREIWDFLFDVWQKMKQIIDEGLNAEGSLPGGLDVQRKAKTLYTRRHIDESSETRENRMVCAYAYATSEQNAAGGDVVIAPTCGSAGVLPAVLLYQQEKRGFRDDEIIRALAVAGLIGNLIRTNASISGAECGCQAEIGSACSMAAAALGELFGMDMSQIEYAAEVAMEHHLGLTCDPIRGLVQIPCIERNAVAAMRAIQAVNLANFLSDTRKISFDLVVQTMYETGKDLGRIYRETGEGGLSKLYR